MACALGPVESSLEELEIMDFTCEKTSWEKHDGTRMDLSRFALLKKLAVPWYCFVQPFQHPFNPFGRAQTGFSELLPFSIEELEVCQAL